MLIHQYDNPTIHKVRMSYHRIDIDLVDGTHISAPLDWYPCLPNEKHIDRTKWEAMRWWVWQHLSDSKKGKQLSNEAIEKQLEIVLSAYQGQTRHLPTLTS